MCFGVLSRAGAVPRWPAGGRQAVTFPAITTWDARLHSLEAEEDVGPLCLKSCEGNNLQRCGL